jgi:hypothetical protein
MFRPCCTDCLNALPIRTLHDGRKIVGNRGLWACSSHAIHEFSDGWREISDDSGIAKKMSDYSPVGNIGDTRGLEE